LLQWAGVELSKFLPEKELSRWYENTINIITTDLVMFPKTKYTHFDGFKVRHRILL
jgi:hypothetical protein